MAGEEYPLQFGWRKLGTERNSTKKNKITHTAKQFMSATCSEEEKVRERVFLQLNDWKEAEIFTMSEYLTVGRIHTLQLTGSLILACRMEILANALKHPGCKVMELDLDGCALGNREMHELAAALQTGHCTLQILDLGHNLISEAGIKDLSEVLQNGSCNLHVLELAFNPIGDKGAEHLCAALKTQSCPLWSLGLYGHNVMTAEGTCKVIEALPRSSVKHLNIGMHKVIYSMEILDMLRNLLNHLETLSCNAIPESQPLSWLDVLQSSNCKMRCLQLKCLYHQEETPTTLASLQALFEALLSDKCRLVELDIVDADHHLHKSLLDAIASNYNCSIEVFRANGMSRELELKCHSILMRNKRLQKLVHEEVVRPSATKLFICGHSGVGKTTFQKNLHAKKLRNLDFRLFEILKPPLSTEGINMSSLAFGDKKVIIYDIAGQYEYHAFHHYFVRGSDKDAFLIICKAEEQREIEKCLRYWLRFIVSHRASPTIKPKVMIALNFFPEHGWWTESEMFSIAKIRTQDIRKEYMEVLDFGADDENILGFVATKPGQLIFAKQRIASIVQELLEDRRVPKLCSKLIQFVQRQKIPLMMDYDLVKEFRQFFQANVEEEIIRDALLHLHDMGEVVYFDREEIVILNVEWFNQDVIRLFINNKNLQERERRIQGNCRLQEPWFQHIEDVKIALLSIWSSDDHGFIASILQCLNQMGVLLPKDESWSRNWSEPPKHLIIPTLLTNPCPHWGADSQEEHKFWGRRYVCTDRKITLLPSGLFSMLQVQLENRHSKWTMHGDMCDRHSYDVGDGWIKFQIHGISAVLKFGGANDAWTDREWMELMINAPKQVQDHEAEKLFLNIRDEIFNTCHGKLGCPNLNLEEKVMYQKQLKH